MSAFEDAFENTLNVLVIMTEKRGNLRNDLKEDILKAVSGLRKEFANSKSEVENKNKLIGNLEMKAAETNTIHKALQSGVGSNCRGVQMATSLGLKVNFKESAWKVPPSPGSTRKRY